MSNPTPTVIGEAPSGGVLIPTAENARGKKRIFRHQLSEIHVGSGSSALASLFYRGWDKDLPSGGLEYGSYFADELGEFTLSNPTKEFRDFKAEVVDLVLTKPLLLHHKKRVAEILQNAITRDTPSLPAFAKLSYHLCKDLGLAFIPFLDGFVTRLISSLTTEKNVLRQDAPLIHTVFLVITGYLRTLSPLIQLSPEDGDVDMDGSALSDAEVHQHLMSILNPVISVMSHKNPGISRLAGEALSVCVRKISSRETLQAVVHKCIAVATPLVERVDESQLATDERVADRAISGVSSLLFECIKGVTGKWHSRFELFIECLLAELPGFGPAQPLEEILSSARPLVAHRAIVGVLQRASSHATPASFLELFAAICAQIEGVLGKGGAPAATGSCILVYLTHFSAKAKLVTSELIRFLSGFCGSHGKGLARLACRSVEAGAESRLVAAMRVPAPLTALGEFVIAYAKHSVMSDTLSKFMGELFGSNPSMSTLCDCIVGLADVPVFAMNVRSQAIAAVEAKCAERESHSLPELLTLLAALYDDAEDEEKLKPACAACTTQAIRSDTEGENARWLGWKLSPHLPEAEQAKLAPAAESVVTDTSAHPIVAAYALRLLLKAGSKSLLSLSAGLASTGGTASAAFFSSPSIATALADVVTSDTVQAAVSASKKTPSSHTTTVAHLETLRGHALAMVRSGHPEVRLSGNGILSAIYGELRGAFPKKSAAFTSELEGERLCAMLAAAHRGESLRMDLLEQNRDKVLSYDGILTVVRDSDDGETATEKIMELAGSLLLGALNVRFRPLWAKAQEGLRLVAERDVKSFWALFTKQLNMFEALETSEHSTVFFRDERRENSSKSRTRARRAAAARAEAGGDESEDEAKEDEDAEGDDAEDAASEGGGDEAGEEEEGPSPSDTASASAAALWETALRNESSSKEAATIQSQFKSLWDLVETLPGGVLQRTVPPSGGEGGAAASLYQNIFTYFIRFEALFAPDAPASDESAEVKSTVRRRRILPPETVTTYFLRILTKQESPEKTLAKEVCQSYRDKLWSLLSSETETIQRLAIQGLKYFKDMQKFAKYEEKLLSILPHKGLKNMLLSLDFEEVRAENVQLAVYQILRPKLWQNKHNTRGQVLQFASGTTEVQFARFMATIVKPIMQANSHFNKRKSESRYLEFLWNLVDGMGTRIESWVQAICDNVMIHLNHGYILPEGQKLTSIHREARRMGLKILTKLFKTFPFTEFTEGFMTKLADTLKGPIAELSSAASTMGALLSFLTCLAEDELLLPILSRLNAVPALVSLLSSPKIGLEVYNQVLKLLSALITTSPDMFKPYVSLYVSGLHKAAQSTFKGDLAAFSYTVQSLEASSAYVISHCTENEADSESAKTLSLLMHLLIDTLLNKKAKPSFTATEACTKVLVEILPKIRVPESVDGEAVAKGAATGAGDLATAPTKETTQQRTCRFLTSVLIKMSPLFYLMRYNGPREKIGLAYVRVLERLQAELQDMEASGKQPTAEQQQKQAIMPLKVCSFMLEVAKLITQSNKVLPDKPSKAGDADAEEEAPSAPSRYKGRASKFAKPSEKGGAYDFDSRISAFYNISDFFVHFGANKRSGAAKGEKGDADAEDVPETRSKKQEKTSALTEFKSLPLEDIRVHLLLPLAYNLAYFVGDTHQSIRTTSALALKSLVKTLKRIDAKKAKKLQAELGDAAAPAQSPLTAYQAVVQPVIHHGARIGVRSDDLSIRQEWLKVYGATCLSFGTLTNLTNTNTDFDFFENITHPQTNRQSKALTLFRQHSSEVPESSLEAIFIPYFLRLLQSWGVDKRKEAEDMTVSESSKLQALTGSLLKTFSHIAGHLSWGKYHRLVIMLLKQEVTSGAMEKSVCQCITEVLDSFHFLPTTEIRPYDFEPYDAEADDGALEEEDATKQPAADAVKKESKPDGDAKMAGDADDGSEEAHEGDKQQKDKRIGDILVEKLIPAVHRFWKKGNKTEDGEERLSLNRISLSTSILKLLKFIPDDVDFDSVVDSLLTDLVSKLKTKKQQQRDRIREVLADSLSVLGPQFLGKIVLLLRAGLEHGYQLHVLGYTVVAMINKAALTFGIKREVPTEADDVVISKVESTAPEGMKVHQCVDGCLNVMLDILLDDNIGVSGTEKEVEELRKTMREVKKNRSLEGFELLATIATPDLLLRDMVNRVQKIFTPMERIKKTYRPEEAKYKKDTYDFLDEKEAELETVDTSNDLHLQSRVKTILRRCARGVTRNALFVAQDMIGFASDTLMENNSNRDRFLDKFEVKQNAMKVRLAETSAASDIANIRRQNEKVHHLVANEPERRDRGFERREVTSQKRQLGSVRKKNRNESKKRIAIPGIQARQTLQSMDCIDELAISVAWNLVNHSKEKGIVPLVGALVDPIVHVAGGEASDSVITLAFLVLNEVMKNNETEVDEERVAEVMELAFDVVERSGDIRSACFRLMAILLLHRQAGFTETQAAVCCSLIRTDLDKKINFVIPALHLVKAIVIRKVEVPDIYDLVPVVQEKMLHHAKSSIIAHVSGSIVARFLTDWRMSEKKLNSHIDFIVKNLQYPIPEGRIALLDLLQVIFQRFPDALLKKEVEYFFVPLAHRLMADDSRLVRKKSAAVMSVLLQLSGKSVASIVTILRKWIGGAAALQITAVQVLNVMFKEPKLSRPYITEFLENLLDATTPASIDLESKSSGVKRRKMVQFHKENWELPYHGLVALDSLLTHHQEALVEELNAERFDRLWVSISGNLSHSHPWVRTAASRLFGNETVHNHDIPTAKLMSAARSFIQQIAELGRTEKVSPEDIESGKGGEIETDVTAQAIALCIKNVAWITKRLHDASASDHQRRAKDMAAIWRQIKLTAYGTEKPTDATLFQSMRAPNFFQKFTAALPGAVVRLAGVLLVKLYGESDHVEEEEEDDASKKRKKPSGGRVRREQKLKRIRKAEEKGDGEAEEADEGEEAAAPAAPAEAEKETDVVFREVRAVVTYIYACYHVPETGSVLGKTASEVLEVLRNTLTSERFVRLFHQCSEDWRGINAAKHSSKLFKSASKGKLVVRSMPTQPAPRKQDQMLPTSDGAQAKAGSKKRKFAAPAGDKSEKRARSGPKRVVKRR